MVGSLCLRCKAKQTTAKDLDGNVCCVACGGIDTRGRPRGKAPRRTASVSTSSSSGSDDDLACGSGGGINFAEAKFTGQADAVPQCFKSKVEEWADGLGFSNKQLWSSFAYFLLLLVEAQPAGFLAEHSRVSLGAAMDGASAFHRRLVLEGCRAGVFPWLDSFVRGRSYFAIRMYRLAFPKMEYNSASLSFWFLLECIFRYAGDPLSLQTFLLEGQLLGRLREICGAGLTEETLGNIVCFMRDAFKAGARGRSSVKAIFSTRDGRRRTYRRKRAAAGAVPEVRKVAPDSKFFDNLVYAIEHWAQHALVVGDSFLKVVSAVEHYGHGLVEADLAVYLEFLTKKGGGEDVLDAAPKFEEPSRRLLALEEAVKDFMYHLLGFDLLGRPASRDLLDGQARFRCYHLKFVWNDAYVLISSLLCSRGRKLSSTCGCLTCKTLWYVRCKFMFFGPSPLAFHCALMKKPPQTRAIEDSTVEVWRRMRRLFETAFTGVWDLYAVQMLPCIWRAFLVALRKHGATQGPGEELHFQWVTDARRNAETVFELETMRKMEVDRWLTHFELAQEFNDLPADGQSRFIKELRLFPTLKKHHVKSLLHKVAEQRWHRNIGMQNVFGVKTTLKLKFCFSCRPASCFSHPFFHPHAPTMVGIVVQSAWICKLYLVHLARVLEHWPREMWKNVGKHVPFWNGKHETRFFAWNFCHHHACLLPGRPPQMDIQKVQNRCKTNATKYLQSNVAFLSSRWNPLNLAALSFRWNENMLWNKIIAGKTCLSQKKSCGSPAAVCVWTVFFPGPRWRYRSHG